MKSQNPLTVSKDLVVSLDYVLQLEDGQEVDRSEAGQPLEYLHGHQQIVVGLERALDGMAVGDEKYVVVAPADGYGDHDPNQVQSFPRAAFPAGANLDEGEILELQDSQSGQSFQAQVVESLPDEIVLDFNHPLAGETLHFEVRIAGLRPATAGELAHGHAHSVASAH